MHYPIFKTKASRSPVGKDKRVQILVQQLEEVLILIFSKAFINRSSNTMDTIMVAIIVYFP